MAGNRLKPTRFGSLEGELEAGSRKREVTMTPSLPLPAKIMTTNIKTIDEMREFARSVAADLKGGDIIGLVGELGAGKTTFTQYLAEALGIENDIKSPTFILFREYTTGEALKKRGILKLVHADAYRIEEEDEFWSIGFDDSITELDTVTVIEWSDKLPSMRDYSTYREFKFSFGEGEERIIQPV